MESEQKIERTQTTITPICETNGMWARSNQEKQMHFSDIYMRQKIKAYINMSLQMLLSIKSISAKEVVSYFTIHIF